MEKEGKVALITGVTGQDGSYLAEYLFSYSIEDDYIEKIKNIIEINDFEDFEDLNTEEQSPLITSII